MTDRSKVYQDLRERALRILSRKEGQSKDNVEELDFKRLLQELEVYEVELELQNQELREKQQMLESATQENQLLFDFAPTGYLVLDSHFHIIRANNIAQTILGKQDISILKQNFYHYINTDDMKEVMDWLHAVIDKPVRALEIRLRTEDAKPQYAQLDVTLQQFGEDRYWQISIMDITERKLLERELKAAKEKAELAVKLRDNFLATMSHELRTPLNSILGFTNIMLGNQSPRMDDEHQRFLGLIHSSGHHLLKLIENVLDMSLLKSGQLKVQPEPLNITSFLHKLQANYLSGSLQERGLNIRLIANEDKLGTITTDPVRLRQILTNLLDNSIKFTEKGTITWGFEEAPPDGMVKIFVEDDGCGIAQENRKVIFEMFRQGDGSTSRRFGGTGLGLAIGRRLAEALGGSLELVRSSTGTGDHGSRFVLTLPTDYAWPSQPEVQKSSPIHFEGNIRSTTPILPKSKPKVMVAEDNAPNLELIVALLDQLDYQPIIARDGLEAVEKTKQAGDIELILMDIQMPHIDGLEATRLIRQWEQETGHARTKILAVTAYAFPEDENWARDAGCDGYLTKPIDTEKLTTLLEKYFYKPQA